MDADFVLLPAFGALCSRMAQKIGLAKDAFMSPGQRAWSASAKAAADALVSAGVRMDRIGIVAFDERSAMAWMDRWRDSEDPRKRLQSIEPDHLGRSVIRHSPVNIFSDDPSQQFHHALIGLRQEPADHLLWKPMRAFFEKDEWARAFVIGHEIAHALFGKEHWDLVQRALVATGTDIGRQGASLLPQIHWGGSRAPIPEQDAEALLFANAIEEAMCDVVGSWVAAQAGCPQAPLKAATLRSCLRDQSSFEYDTAWMTQNIAPLGADFEKLNYSHLRLIMVDICKIHGHALATRLSKAPANLAQKLAQRRQSQDQPRGQEPPRRQP
jgi:hypothetical protein